MTRRRDLLSDEGGFVMIIVVLMLLVALGLATAALSAALDSSASTSRDARERRAQQGADAGIQTELYQQSQVDLGSTTYNLNGGLIGLGTTIDCSVPQLNASLQVTGVVSAALNAAGVCPQALNSGGTSTTYTPALGNHTFYQAEMFPNEVQLKGNSSQREEFPEILSLGSETTPLPAGSGTVYSREAALLAPIGPLQAVEGMGNVTLNGLTALGLGTLITVNGDVLALGKLTTPALVTAVNLSSSSLLPTFAASSFGGTIVSTAQNVSATPCSASTSSANRTNCVIQRPSVTVSSTKPDCSVAANCAALGAAYNATTDTFSMSSGTVEFQPGDYVFCNFNATGGTVEVNPTTTAPVRIFIDSANSSRCKNDGLGSNQGNFNASNGIDNLLEPASPLGTTLAPSGLQIYVAGDGNGYDNATTVNVGNQSSSLVSLSPVTQGMVIYAPTSSVTVNTGVCITLPIVGKVCAGGIFDGSVVGDNVNMTAGTITQDLDIGNYPLYAGVNAFRPVQYIQCSTSVTSLTGSTSDLTGC